MVFFIAITLFAHLSYGASDCKGSFEDLLASTGRVKTPYGSGSGFFIGPNLFVTAHHNIEKVKKGVVKIEKSQFSVTKNGNQKLTYSEEYGFIVVKNLDYDLAIIETITQDHKTLKLGLFDDVQLGDDVFVLGSPEEFTNTLSQGIVSAKRFDMEHKMKLQITADIRKGSSGSPVLNSDFEVIGIAVVRFFSIDKKLADYDSPVGKNSKKKKKERKESSIEYLNFALPVTYLKELLEKQGIDFSEVSLKSKHHFNEKTMRFFKKQIIKDRKSQKMKFRMRKDPF